MDSLRTLLRRYPNRIKYGLFIVDIIAMILAIRTYVNYVSIEVAIDNATIEKQVKSDELAFTQNFLLPYEKSEYASYFLQHENNMLQRDEYIIKFEEMYQKQEIDTGDINQYIDYEDKDVNSPQESWEKFIMEKIKK